MNNLIKKGLYTTAGLALVGLNTTKSFANSSGFFGEDREERLRGEEASLEVALQNYISYLMTFLYLIAVAYALWGGFQILTAGGDEEKVKKGKTILIQGGIGLLVIFIAGSIVSWVLGILAQ